MKRTPLNKIGNIGKANLEARSRIAQHSAEMGITSCELKFKGCQGIFGIAPCHKERRDWYGGDVDKLSDPKQWVAGCQFCHEVLDNRSKTTKQQSDDIFNKLRP